MTETNPYDQLNNSFLTELGFNLQAVFKMHQLPQTILDTIPVDGGAVNHEGRSLLMLGHGGKRFWRGYLEHRSKYSAKSPNPIDDYCVEMAKQYMRKHWPSAAYHVLYPGPDSVGLQQLGVEAGWHHDSPLKVGINATWGLWYAYRVLLLVEAELPATQKVLSTSPCDGCQSRACIKACPVEALSQEDTMLQRCVSYRKQKQSLCQFTCLAREACPVQSHHQYEQDQTHYHYQRSYQTITTASFCINTPNTVKLCPRD